MKPLITLIALLIITIMAAPLASAAYTTVAPDKLGIELMLRGNATDTSGNGFSPVAANVTATALASCFLGNSCMNFSNNYIILSDQSFMNGTGNTGTQSWTYSMVTNINKPGGQMGFWWDNNDEAPGWWGLTWNDTNNGCGQKFSMLVGDNPTDRICGSSTADVGQWYHVVVTYDDATNNQSLWINGTYQNSVARASYTRLTTTFRIGDGNYHEAQQGLPIYAKLANVRTWRAYALNSSQITTLYQEDVGVPFTQFVSPTPTTGTYNTTAVTLTLNATATANTVSISNITINVTNSTGSVIATTTASSNQTTLTFTPPYPGTYTFTAYSYNTNGEKGTTATRTWSYYSWARDTASLQLYHKFESAPYKEYYGIYNDTVSLGGTATGKIGNAAAYSGSSGNYSVLPVVAWNTSGTVNLWIKQPSLAAAVFLESNTSGGDKGPSIQIANIGGWKIYFRLEDSSFDTCSISSLTDWTMITYTWDGTRAIGYINGTLCVNNSNTKNPGDYAPMIGKDNGGSAPLNGYIDEFSAFSRTLSANEVAYLYNSGSPDVGQQPPFSPVAQFVSPTPASGSYNVTATAYVLNATSYGPYTISNITINVTNSSGSVVATTTANGNETYLSFTPTYPDTYTFSTYSYDVYGNRAVTSTRTWSYYSWTQGTTGLLYSFMFNGDYVDSTSGYNLTATGTGNIFNTTFYKLGNSSLYTDGNGGASKRNFASISGSQNLSVTGWFNIRNQASYKALFMWGNNANYDERIAIDLPASGQIRFHQGASDNLLCYGFTPGSTSWTYITATYNQATKLASLYLNGTLCNSTTFSAALNLVTNAANAGISVLTDTGTTSQETGAADDVFFFNRVLTQAECQYLYANGNPTSAQQPPFLSSTNTAPNATTPTLSPSVAYDSTNITASSVYTDADGNNGSMSWVLYVNGVANQTGTNTSVANGTNVSFTFDASNYNYPDRLIVQVTPNDGTVSGTAMNSSQLNTSALPPLAPTITSPTNTTYETSINITWTASTKQSVNTQIVNYTVGLYNSTFGFVDNLSQVNGSTLYYNWAINATNGNYYIGVYATDNVSQNSNVSYQQFGIGYTTITATTITPTNPAYLTTLTNIQSTVDTPYGSVKAILTDPSGAIVVNVNMTNTSATAYSYALTYQFTTVGNYTLTIATSNVLGATVNQNTTIAIVSLSTPTVTDGVYAYDTRMIESTANIGTLVNTYGYDALGFTINYSRWNSDWASLKDALNASYQQNAAAFITIRFNNNSYASSTAECAQLTNLSDMLLGPYSETLRFIVIQTNNTDTYNEKVFTNEIASCIRTKINNLYPIYSYYNNSNLSADYVSYWSMPRITDEASLITYMNTERAYFTNTTSKSRVYHSPTLNVTFLNATATYHDDVIVNLRGTPLGTVFAAEPRIGKVSNGDFVIYNNGSSTSLSVNVVYANTSDAWNYQNKEAEANLSATANTSFVVVPYQATLVFVDDFDRITMTSDTEAKLYQTSGTVLNTSGSVAGDADGALSIYGAWDARMELWDASYTYQNLAFVTYEVLSATKVIDYDQYDVLIIAGGTSNTPANVNTSLQVGTYPGLLNKTYGYISVADYNNTNSSGGNETNCSAVNPWETAKISEAQVWTTNYTTNVFIDGFDIGYVNTPSCFEQRIKRLADDIRITQGKKVIFNTYTIYQSVANYGDRIMRESCFARWDGAVGNPTYSYENWTLVENNAAFLNSIGKPVICMAFGDVNDYDKLAYTYHAFAVVYGADNNHLFRYGQPNFQGQREIRVVDFGDMLQTSFDKSNPADYTRRYSKGIVHVNPLRNQTYANGQYYWFDDGNTVSDVTISAYYQNYASACDSAYDMRIIVNDNQTLNVTCTEVGMPQWTSKWLNHNFTASYTPNGHYYVRWYPSTRAGSTGINLYYRTNTHLGVRSWYDSSANNPPTETQWTEYGRSGSWGDFHTNNYNVILNITQTSRSVVDTFDVEDTVNITYPLYNNANYYAYNYSLVSSKRYNIPFLTTLAVIPNLYFANITFGGSFVNSTNTSTCDDLDPVLAYTTISGYQHGACYEQNASSTNVKLLLPNATGTTVYSLNTYEQINFAPVMNTSRISPTTLYKNTTETFYCLGSDADGDNVTYNYNITINGVLNVSGTSNTSVQGVETLVYGDLPLLKGMNVTLWCQANDSNTFSATSTWLNSTTLMVQNLVPFKSASSFTDGIAHKFNYTVTINDTDNSTDLSSFSLSVTNAACSYLSNTTTTDAVTMNYNCTGTPDTTATLTLNATDKSSDSLINTETHAVPNNAPTAPVAISPKGTTTSSTSSFTLTWNGSTDADSDAINYTITVNKTETSATSTYTTPNTNITYTAAQAGTYVWTVVATDNYDVSAGSSGNFTYTIIGTGGASSSSPKPSTTSVIDMTKKKCNVLLQPSVITITDEKRVVEVTVANWEFSDYQPVVTFSDVEGKTSASNRVRLAEPLENAPARLLTKVYFEYRPNPILGDVPISGATEAVFTSDECQDITLPIYVEISSASAVSEAFINDNGFINNLQVLAKSAVIPELTWLKVWLVFTLIGFLVLSILIDKPLAQREGVDWAVKSIVWLIATVLFTFLVTFGLRTITG